MTDDYKRTSTGKRDRKLLLKEMVDIVLHGRQKLQSGKMKVEQDCKRRLLESRFGCFKIQ